MPRQPFRTKYGPGGTSFGLGFVAQRPKAAALVGEIIANWTEIELQLSLVLGNLLPTDHEGTIGIFNALRQSRTQFQVLEAAAKSHPDGRVETVVKRLTKACHTISNHRNDFAHGLFGVSAECPDGLLWVPLDDQAVHHLNLSRNLQDGYRMTAAHIDNNVFVYELRDLEKIVEDMHAVHKFAGRVCAFISAKPQRDQIFAELLKQLPTD